MKGTVLQTITAHPCQDIGVMPCIPAIIKAKIGFVIAFIINTASVIEGKVVVFTHFILGTDIEDVRIIVITLEKIGNFLFCSGKASFLQFILCQRSLS